MPSQLQQQGVNRKRVEPIPNLADDLCQPKPPEIAVVTQQAGVGDQRNGWDTALRLGFDEGFQCNRACNLRRAWLLLLRDRLLSKRGENSATVFTDAKSHCLTHLHLPFVCRPIRVMVIGSILGCFNSDSILGTRSRPVTAPGKMFLSPKL